jgi:uncharacterized protein YgbK (DUF1537 family)
MSKLLLTFYGDDFTGSTDALEQLACGGVRAALFIEPPTKEQLAHFKNLEAIGVAGRTRSLTPAAMERELKPALLALKKLGARHVHYKICSTFDSSPQIGSIGKVIDLATEIFHPQFIPVLAAAPALGRFTIFGNHFARFGIGSDGEIHRLDCHPSISKHPVTPMTEADLCVHLAKQTRKRIALFDILKVSQLPYQAQMDFDNLLAEMPDVVLFDALMSENLIVIGRLLEAHAKTRKPLFSVGSSAIEMALGANWPHRIPRAKIVPPAKQILIGSGSCSPVTSGQIEWALKNGFSEVSLSAKKLMARNSQSEIRRAVNLATKLLRSGHSVIVHTTRSGANRHVAAKLKNKTAEILGTALGKVLRGALEQIKVTRICVAGGDTSSYAARALGIEAVEWIASLNTPGAPLCRAHAPGSPVDKREIIFKGGQVGAENYFQTVLKGNS